MSPGGHRSQQAALAVHRAGQGWQGVWRWGFVDVISHSLSQLNKCCTHRASHVSLHAGCPLESFYFHLFLGSNHPLKFSVCSAMTLPEPKAAPGALGTAPSPVTVPSKSCGTSAHAGAPPVRHSSSACAPHHKHDTHQLTPSTGTRLRCRKSTKHPKLRLGNL